MKGDEKMPKINIKVTLITPEQKEVKQYKAIFHPEENSIMYKEQDKTTTKVNLKYKKLRRENEELLMEYLFAEEKNTKGRVTIKSLNKTLELNLKATKINQVDKNIEINYVLENDEYKYKLEVI